MMKTMTMKKILICGLPGSGKTTLATALVYAISKAGPTVDWLNADDVRARFEDWDFTNGGRLRQSERMRDLAHAMKSIEYVIADFVCPTEETREAFGADFVVWTDTIASGRFANTNAVFVSPETYDLRITEFGAADKWAAIICAKIMENNA